ncbi:MAG: hypothetical protein LBH00_12975 [Planctomycetaceae bacterium]|nr:hypothetical protein [Planctomycetaceae bacterium]
MCYHQWRQPYASWTMFLHNKTFEVVRRYKHIEETATFDWDDIADIRRGEPVDEFWQNGFPVFGRFPPLLCNQGSHRLELVLTDGTVEYLPQLPFEQWQGNMNNNRLCNVLNGFMNGERTGCGF